MIKSNLEMMSCLGFLVGLGGVWGMGMRYGVFGWNGLLNHSIWSMDVYGCKEQDLTSSQVLSWIRVLGLFWLSLGQLAGVHIF